MDAYKPIPMPLNPPGVFDARSSGDNQLPNAFAWKQNFQVSKDGQLQHANGYIRAYATHTIFQTNGVPCPYKNWDFHDQAVSTIDDREPPTLLFYSTANDGTRQLYLGTKTRLFVLDEVSGEWTQLTGATLGDDSSDILTSTRFKAAQLQDNLYFVNGLDDVYYTDVTGTALTRLSGLDGAGVNGANVSAPFVVIQWSGVLLIMNIKEGDKRFASRIRWSDLEDGTWWLATDNPNTSLASLADYQDLTYGERILGAIPLLDALYVLTDRAIWRCVFVVDPVTLKASLKCTPIYQEPKNQSRCLAYPNTLVSDGRAIYYASRDAIYKYDPYMALPERTEWIYRASSIIFDEGIGGIPIDSTSCNAVVAEYWPDRKEIHFCWPTPDAKLVNPQDCNLIPPQISSGINNHTLVINTEWETCDYRDYGMTAMANFTSNLASVGQCNQTVYFLSADGNDFTVKQIGVGYAREAYSPITELYTVIGYTPILLGEFNFLDFDKDKEIKEFLIDGYADASGNVYALQLGMSHTQMRVNALVNPTGSDGNCGVVWHKLSNKPVKCKMKMTPAQYAAKRIKPATDTAWQYVLRGRFLYYYLSVKTATGGPPSSGGLTLTRFEVKAIDA